MRWFSADVHPGHGQSNDDDNVDDVSSNNTYRTAQGTSGDGSIDGHGSVSGHGSDGISIHRSINSTTSTGTSTTTDPMHTKHDSDSSSGVSSQSGFGSMDLAAGQITHSFALISLPVHAVPSVSIYTHPYMFFDAFLLSS